MQVTSFIGPKYTAANTALVPLVIITKMLGDSAFGLDMVTVILVQALVLPIIHILVKVRTG